MNTQKKHFPAVICCGTICGLALLTIMSCGVKSAGNNAGIIEESVEAPVMRSMAVADSASFTGRSPSPSPTVSAKVSGSAAESGSSLSETQERKLIKTGSISLEVEQLAAAEAAVTAWCEQFNGYIESSYNEQNHSSYTVKIPAGSFDAAMDAAGNLGTVKYRNISARDVSEQFYDLETRLETRKILKERLQTYLTQAKDIEDMLQIETSLNNTLAELESMEGQMRRLSNQIDYSTISVDISLPYRTSDTGFQWPEFGESFRKFAANIVDFFAGFIIILLYIVICGIPVLAVVAVLFWLLLGKVGLLRKLYNKLKK